jgi:hypothetical protein
VNASLAVFRMICGSRCLPMFPVGCYRNSSTSQIDSANLTAETIVEAVGLFHQRHGCLSRPHVDFRPNDQLRRNATALPPHVTMSHTPLHRHSSVGK